MAFAENPDAVIRQSNNKIKELKDKIQELDTELTNLKATKKEIDFFIAEAYRKKSDEFDESVKKFKEEKIRSDALDKKRKEDLEIERKEFEECRDQEVLRTGQIAQSTKTANKNAIALKDRKTAELQHLKDERISVSVTQEELNDKVAKVDEQIKLNKETERNNSIAEDSLSDKLFKVDATLRIVEENKTESERLSQEAKDKLQEAEQSKEYNEEKELALDERQAGLEKSKERVQDKNIEAILLGKRNSIEEARLKDLAKTLRNQEAQIDEKNKLFKTKTGGEI